MLKLFEHESQGINYKPRNCIFCVESHLSSLPEDVKADNIQVLECIMTIYCPPLPNGEAVFLFFHGRHHINTQSWQTINRPCFDKFEGIINIDSI